ncbi:Hypothetical predicted protein [Pelobates cultripes]|uniref:Uncharacterized protein n=1 Tax=Pelobates cultripes TaxID=61616 RepID=A0AAD1SBK3_PELCU|nr:Hypothetical predicted protein [Pelobates cultripes]
MADAMRAEGTKRAGNNAALAKHSAHRHKPACYPQQPEISSHQGVFLRHLPLGTQYYTSAPAPGQAQKWRRRWGHSKTVPAAKWTLKTKRQENLPLRYAGVPASHMKSRTTPREGRTSPYSQHKRRCLSQHQPVRSRASQSPLKAAAQRRPEKPHRSPTTPPVTYSEVTDYSFKH